MPGPARIVRTYPITTFAVLACLFGWGIFISAGLGLGSNPDNMPLGPLLAALVVASCQGREALGPGDVDCVSGTRRRSGTPWPCSPRSPSTSSNVVVNHWLGAPLPTAAQLGHWPEVPVAFLVMLVMVGIGEEAGWTAFAAPLLLSRHGIFGAWVVLSLCASCGTCP